MRKQPAPSPTLEQRLARTRDEAIANIKKGPSKKVGGDARYKKQYLDTFGELLTSWQQYADLHTEYLLLYTKTVEDKYTINALRSELELLQKQLRDTQRMLPIEDENTRKQKGNQ